MNAANSSEIALALSCMECTMVAPTGAEGVANLSSSISENAKAGEGLVYMDGDTRWWRPTSTVGAVNSIVSMTRLSVGWGVSSKRTGQREASRTGTGIPLSMGFSSSADVITLFIHSVSFKLSSLLGRWWSKFNHSCSLASSWKCFDPSTLTIRWWQGFSKPTVMSCSVATPVVDGGISVTKLSQGWQLSSTWGVSMATP